MLGLAASERQGISTCPSAEQLATFVEGRLKGQDRQRFLAHLNRCPQCYYQWLEIGTYLVDAAPSTETRKKPLAKIRERFISFAFTNRPLGISLATALALLSIVVLWPSPPNLHERIGRQLVLFSTPKANQALLVQGNMALPWEGAALGFSGVRLTPQKQAFGAGLWSGRHALVADRTASLPQALSPPSGHTWFDSDWQPYYEFGRWTVLLWALTRWGHSPQDWISHRAIFNSLRSQFEKSDEPAENTKPFVEALARLGPKLENADRKGDRDAYQDLSRHLLMMMHTLGPSNL